MSDSFTITPMLDEEDNDPVFEVKTGDGEWMTNCTSLDQAFQTIREMIKPAKTLEQLATDWVMSHGTVWYDDSGADLMEELEVSLTPDQLDIVARLVQSAKVTVTFNA